jgi:hypothetical protein
MARGCREGCGLSGMRRVPCWRRGLARWRAVSEAPQTVNRLVAWW